MWKRVEKWMLEHEWLFLILVVIVVLRIPTLFEPYWYGDEGIYLTIGHGLRKGAELYKDIHDNKPPFLYLVAAVANGNQFWYRLIAGAWNLATVVVCAKLAQKIFRDNSRVKVITVLVFALLTNLPLWEGNIANAELFFILPTLSAVYLLLNKNLTFSRIFFAGLLIGMGGLFKIPAVLEAGIWPLVWWAGGEKKWIGKSIWLAVGVLAPLILSGAYFAGRDVLPAYLTAAGLGNVPYLSSWKVGTGTGLFTLKGRMVAALVLLAILWGLAKSLGGVGTWVGVWGVVTLFAALLSGRPYPHYLLQMAGVIAIGTGVLIVGRKSEKAVIVFIIVLVIAAYRLFGFYSYPVREYYVNFASWVLGQQSQREYYKWFNPAVTRNYEIAGMIMNGSRADDPIFVWGDEPMIYALAKRQPMGKYTVAYHIKEFGAQEETMKKLLANPPKYVVSFGNEGELPGFKELLEWRYHLEKRVEDARIYRLTGLSWWRY